jgi:glycosyltransferase involved in cell wall biosynthesis
MGAGSDRLVNFPYWIDNDLYAQRAAPCLSNATRSIRFISSGRIVNSLKGHDLAIRSLAKVLAEVPTFNFTYQIAGVGPDSIQLEELINYLGLAKRVSLLGWMEPNDLVEVMCNSDVLLHPSPEHDPYGVAVIEAMAAGMVVLASDVTGAALDRIKHGANGLIHRAGDVDDMVKQLISVISDVEQASLMGLRARETAERWNISAGLQIIETLLNDTR